MDNQFKTEEQSKYFKGLSKAEENQIFSQIDALPISQYEKNLRADTMYKDMLNKKKHTQFLNDRMGATNEINDRAASSKDPVESQTLKTQGKFGQLADMVRNLMYEKEGMNLDNYQDEDVVAAFLKDNPNMVDQFNSFMNGDISAESFSERNGFNYNAIDKAVDEVFGSANGTTASYVNQQSEGEWNDEFFGRLDTETLDQGASVKGFLKNLAKSTWNVVADVGNMVVNPFDTANALAKTAVGAGMNALGLDENLDEEGWLAEANQVADGLGDFLKERYGGKKEILNTLYSDPMGVVSDIASVVTGGAGLVKGVAGGIAKGAAKVGLANTSRTAGNISKTASRVMNIANKADPYTLATDAYTKGGKAAIAFGGKTADKVATFAQEKLNIDNFVGLDKDTKKAIQDNPYMSQVWEQAQDYINENGLPQKPQEVSKQLMEGVKEEIQGAFKEIRSKLGEMGPEYKKLKESGAKVSFYDINNRINEILENAGVQISPKGGLDFSKTAISSTESAAIRRIYNWARTTDSMNISEYMRYRKAIDQLNLWEDAKGTPGKNVLKQIREAGNEVAHEQVEPLKALDKEFSEKSAALDRLSEGLVYREKRKAGQLKDNINQILKNLDEPSKRQLSNRLQEFLPGIEQKVSAINKLPEMIKAYNQVDHAGEIVNAILGAATVGGIGGGVVGAGAGAVLGYLVKKGYSKLKKERWEKALNNLSEVGKQKLAEIEGKLQAKEELSTAEKNYIKAIGKNIEDGNFKENQVSSKTATNQDVYNGLVESIESITDEANQYTDADIKVMEQYLEESRKDLSESDYKDLKNFLDYQKNEYEIAKGEREFYESGEAQRIINGEDEKAVKDFQSRILRIENEEKNVGKVAGKKVNRAYAEQQQRNLEAKREKLIEEIGEYYGIDQFAAADKYDQLRDTANVNKVKFQVAEPTTSKEFKDWFGDWENDPKNASKIVNEDGTPKVVYHGTPYKEQINIFDKNRAGKTQSADFKGIFFTDEKGVADIFSHEQLPGSSSFFVKLGEKGNVYSTYLNIKNPLDFNKKITKEFAEELYNYRKITPQYGGGVLDYYPGAEGKEKFINQVMNSHPQSIKFLLDMDKVEKAGYDGYIAKMYGGDTPGNEYVVWDSNQIKSATDNVGTFDKNNPDIRFQKFGTAGAGEKSVNAIQGLNIRNFKNGKSVKELADNYGIKTHIVNSISTPEGQKAYGMYGDRVITLARDLKESTVPHELLHATFDMVDQGKKNQILDGIKERLKVDDVQAEEWLADNFSEYYRTGKFDTKSIPTTFVGKVKQFFQQIKEYIDGIYANRKEIQNLFDDIIDGKLEGEYGVYSDPKFQSVWHGSPAAFEKFDSSHMGEGEGAQAHGWGHYVAVEERTGRHYADMGGKSEIGFRGRRLREIANDIIDAKFDGTKYDVEEGAAAMVLNQMDNGYDFKKAKEYAINSLNELIKDFEREGGKENKIKEYQGDIKAIEALSEKDFNTIYNRNLYNVEIPDPKKADTPTGKNYIEEDEKIGKSALNKMVDWFKKDGWEVEDSYGNVNVSKGGVEFGLGDGTDTWKYIIQNEISNQKAFSQALNKMGYDGIHYFGGRDGEAYVIFNDDALKINSHEQY